MIKTEYTKNVYQFLATYIRQQLLSACRPHTPPLIAPDAETNTTNFSSEAFSSTLQLCLILKTLSGFCQLTPLDQSFLLIDPASVLSLCCLGHRQSSTPDFEKTSQWKSAYRNSVEENTLT